MDDTFREITLGDALEIAKRKTVHRFEERDDRLIVAIFDDGTEIAWQSEVGPSYDETPDGNWQPPTIWVRQCKPSF